MLILSVDAHEGGKIRCNNQFRKGTARDRFGVTIATIHSRYRCYQLFWQIVFVHLFSFFLCVIILFYDSNIVVNHTKDKCTTTFSERSPVVRDSGTTSNHGEGAMTLRKSDLRQYLKSTTPIIHTHFCLNS